MLIGTLPGLKPSALTVRARRLSRDSTSFLMRFAGRVSVILRSSLSRVSTVTAMVISLVGLVVRGGGLEPPHHRWRQDLNLVRLPISPPAQTERGERPAPLWVYGANRAF